MNTSQDHNFQLGKWIGGAALGALVMYMLDPDRGAPRRAESRAKLRQLGKQTGKVFDQVVDEIGSSARHATSGLRNVATEAAASLHHSAERVADSMTSMAGAGHSASSSGASSMGMSDSSSWRSSGEDPVRMSTRAGQADLGSGAWGSGMRGAAMAGGGALGLFGLMTPRSPLALALGLAGLALLARGAANRPLHKLVPGAAQARPVDIERSVRIDASPEQVYDMFANYENFPRLFSNVLEVRDLGNRRSHWVVKGPAGSHYSWNAVLSEHSRPQRLAWQSEPGAEVENHGSIHFEPVGSSSTRVTVRMSYKPPAGIVGRAIASLFGNEPGQQMDEDLKRMKALVERGSAPVMAQHSGSSHEKFLH